jgi:hypothetical protein
MDKDHILDEIGRTAKENSGSPLGQARFRQQTGITQADWAGRYWARWGDVLREAGSRQTAYNGRSPKSGCWSDSARSSGSFVGFSELAICA